MPETTLTLEELLNLSPKGAELHEGLCETLRLLDEVTDTVEAYSHRPHQADLAHAVMGLLPKLRAALGR